MKTSAADSPTNVLPVPPNNPIKTARARISKRKRAKGLELLQKLNFLIDSYPEFAGELQIILISIRRQTERTFHSDRERVLLSIEQGAWTVTDIMDDTRLSRWDVEQILINLQELKLIYRDSRRIKGNGNEYTEHLYKLTHD